MPDLTPEDRAEVGRGGSEAQLRIIADAIRAETRRCAEVANEVAKRFDGGCAKKTHRDKAAGARAAARAILGEGG